MTTEKIIKRNMRAERARMGLTTEQVAERIGVHKNAVSRWENGLAEPTAGNLVSLCRLYGCSPEYLLDMTDDRHSACVAP